MASVTKALALILGALLLSRVHAAQPRHAQDKWQLKPMAKEAWYGTTGQPLRMAIYCGNTLGLPSTRTIEALCNISNAGYFSKSGADMLMAARFGGEYSYGAGLWRSNASSTPYTTDPNTPWMVADLVMTVTKDQARVDSWKGVSTEAQVDLFLCSDPSCDETMVDMQSVVRDGTTQEASWSLGLTVLQTPSGMLHRWKSTLLGFAQGHIREGMRSLASGKPPLVDAVVGFSAAAREGLDIQQVHWLPLNRTWQSAQEVLWNVAPLRMQTRLFGRGNDPMHHMRYGVYKATEIAGDTFKVDEARLAKHELTLVTMGATPEEKSQIERYYRMMSPGMLKGACVLIIYPRHQRMAAGGWNVSDPECMAGSKENILGRIRVLTCWKAGCLNSGFWESVRAC